MAKRMVSRKRKIIRKESAHSLRQIRLFATDVDGVLTDAGMYYAESGDEWKKFNTHDGSTSIHENIDEENRSF